MLDDFYNGSVKRFQEKEQNAISGFVADSSTLRKQAAGLFESTKGGDNNVGVQVNTNGGQSLSDDWRVRISLPSGANGLFYQQAGLQSILARTNGVIFPNTPSITVTHNARYSEQALTHSNYKNYFYEGSDVQAITIQGDFTVQNIDDGQYLLAALYFFRSSTKMFFGNDELAGNPPPIVFLDGYGDFYFPHVSCVITSFTHTLPPDVDYMQVPYGNGGTKQFVYLPTISQLSVTVQPVYSRKNVFTNMSLNDFSQGKLLQNRGGFL